MTPEQEVKNTKNRARRKRELQAKRTQRNILKPRRKAKKAAILAEVKELFRAN